MYKSIPKEIRDQIMSRIKNDGISVTDAAKDAGISTKTIYGWLSQESRATDCNLIEMNRLKRENQGLQALVGKLTFHIEKSKRGR
jgi:transposase